MRDLIQPFRRAMRELVGRSEAVVVAVSGGSDSMALLDMVGRAAPGLGLDVVVVHVDHAWRIESSEDARFVAAAAAARGIPAVVERALGLPPTEAAGRQARHRVFARVGAEHGAAGVLLGHSADDQAETVLLHMLRGAGPAGLAGMRPRTVVEVDDRPLVLLRPLLGITRARLRDYCQERSVPFRDDPSNLSPDFLRNRVRHELLPLMTSLAPAGAEALVRLAETAAAEAELIDRCLDRAWNEVIDEGPPLVVERAAFARWPVGGQRGLLRRIAARLGAPGDEVGLERIEAAREALARGRGGAVIEWPGSLRLTLAGPRGVFTRESPS